MKLKTIIISILLVVATYIVAINLYDLYTIIFNTEYVQAPIPPAAAIGIVGPMTGMSVSTGIGINVSIENSDTWSTVAKLITTVLGTYLGMKLINKYIKNEQKQTTRS